MIITKKSFNVFMVFVLALLFSFPPPSFADVNSVTYSGQLENKKIHTYSFNVGTEGALQIDGKDQVENVSYTLFNQSEDKEYDSGDTLTVGSYNFSVFANETGSFNYSFTLSGVTFSGTPNTTLPTLNITSPTESLRLNKGVKNVLVTGTSSEANSQIDVSSITGSNASTSVTGNNISKNVALNFGENTVNVSTSSSSGNTIISAQNVISPGTLRIDGTDRYATSANISKYLLDSDTVLISTALNFPDALSGVPLAVQNKAPILLTTLDTLPAATKDEIVRRKATKAIILGGTGVVSANVETQLKSAGITQIERISGVNRYEGSTLVAKKIINPESDTAFLVYGEDFPDALAVSTLAGKSGIPILLTKTGALEPSVLSFITNNTQIKHFIVVGGPALINDNVLTSIQSLGRTTERIYGATRYETSRLIAEAFSDSTNNLVIADGTTFPDALAGGVLAAIKDSPLLLTTPSSLATETGFYLEKNQSTIDNIYVLGGTGSVSDTALNQANSYIR